MVDFGATRKRIKDGPFTATGIARHEGLNYSNLNAFLYGRLKMNGAIAGRIMDVLRRYDVLVETDDREQAA